MFCSQNGGDLDLTNKLVVCWPMCWQCVGRCVGSCWWCVSRVSADAVADVPVGLDSLPLPLELASFSFDHPSMICKCLALTYNWQPKNFPYDDPLS